MEAECQILVRLKDLEVISDADHSLGRYSLDDGRECYDLLTGRFEAATVAGDCIFKYDEVTFKVSLNI